MKVCRSHAQGGRGIAPFVSAIALMILCIALPNASLAYHDDRPWIPIPVSPADIPDQISTGVSFMFDPRSADRIELFRTDLPPYLSATDPAPDINISVYRFTGEHVCQRDQCPHVIVVQLNNTTGITIIWSRDIVRTNYELHHGAKGRLNRAIAFTDAQNRTVAIVFPNGMVSVSTTINGDH